MRALFIRVQCSVIERLELLPMYITVFICYMAKSLEDLRPLGGEIDL